MNRIANVSFLVGDRVEVATNFTHAWVGGFEIASTSTAGCHVRRMSDGEVLPAVFSYDDVRPARPRPDVETDYAGAALIQESLSDARIVLRLPADLDIATVEAIHDAVIDAVDNAGGEIVLDLDGVRFIDSYGIRLLVTVRRRAWDRDLPFRLHGGQPLIRDLLELVGQDPLYQPERPPATSSTHGNID